MPSAIEPPSTRLQVDELILDYLLWYCTSALLTEKCLRSNPSDKQQRDEAARNGDMGIRLVNSFHSTFKRQHPHAILPEPLILRLRICRFTVALLRRLDLTSETYTTPFPTSSIRTSSWLRRRLQSTVFSTASHSHIFHTLTPFSLGTLQRAQQESIASASGWRGELTLRDALWEFMLLATHMSARFAEAGELWMEIATQFMVQAAVEAYRVLGGRGVAGVDEAFAFGLTEGGGDEESIEEIVVNEMFAGDDGGVGKGFERLREEALRGLLPPNGVSLETHFENIARSCPYSEFEDTLVGGYLEAVAKSQPPPALAQLEQGHLEGFNTRDIQTVLRNAGVSEVVWQ